MNINLKERFQLRDGTIVEGAEIGAWDTLENFQTYVTLGYNETKNQLGAQWMETHCSWETIGEGVWIPSLNRRFSIADVLHLCVPFDREKNEIKVGDVIYYSMRDLTVSKMRVEQIDTGGSMNCTLKGTDLFTNKKTKNSYPKRCLRA